jgi:hypothetical protein
MSETATPNPTPNPTWQSNPNHVQCDGQTLSIRFDRAGRPPRNMDARLALLVDLLRDELAALLAVREYAERVRHWKSLPYNPRAATSLPTTSAAQEAEGFAAQSRHPAVQAVRAHAAAYTAHCVAIDDSPALLRELAERVQDLLRLLAVRSCIQAAHTFLVTPQCAEESAASILDALLPQ